MINTSVLRDQNSTNGSEVSLSCVTDGEIFSFHIFENNKYVYLLYCDTF